MLSNAIENWQYAATMSAHRLETVYGYHKPAKLFTLDHPQGATMTTTIGPISHHFPCTTLRAHNIAARASDEHEHAYTRVKATPHEEGAVI